MNELTRQSTKPVQPVDQHQSAQPDQKHGPSDTPHPPSQAGPAAGHPDAQQYMNLDKQGPNTAAQSGHNGADAIHLQTVPPVTDHATPAPTGTRPDTAHTADTGHTAVPGQVAETGHAPEAGTAHPAETKHPAETGHSTDAQHGPTPAAAYAPGAGPGVHDRATDAHTAREVHETPADRELRLHLQPFGVTPEQARDYMRIALVPQLQLNPMTKMTIDDIQRAGNAVSHLPPQQLDHLTTQARAADSAGRPALQTIDLSHQPAVPRFNLDPSPPLKLQQMPQLRIGPPPSPQHNPLTQPAPKSADQQNDLAKKTADYAAQGNPSHRVADIPDSERVTEGDWDKLVDLTKDATGAGKLTHILEANASHLTHELARNPAAAATAIIAAVSIVAGGTATDMATRHPANPDAPSPTAAGPTSALGEALDSHLAAVGGLKALNLVLGLLGDHPKISADFDVTPGTRPSHDGLHPATRGEIKGTIGVEFEF